MSDNESLLVCESLGGCNFTIANLSTVVEAQLTCALDNSDPASILSFSDSLCLQMLHSGPPERFSSVSLSFFADSPPQEAALAALASQLAGAEFLTISGDVEVNYLVAALQPLTTLKNLSITQNNRFTWLDRATFPTLVALEHLQVSNSLIDRVEGDSFADLTNLRTVDLSGNQLSRLPATPFAVLTFLDMLILTDNLIAALPSELVRGLTSLRGLLLSGNRITALPSGFLQGLSNLQVLNVADNALSALQPDAFHDQSIMHKLELSGNNITLLPEGIFAPMPLLDHLRFTNNKLSHLPSDIFKSNPKLVYLSLRTNQIHQLPADIFKGLSHLGILAFGDNKLTVLPNGLLSDVTRLTWLAFGGNSITELDDQAFVGLSALEWLSLDRNHVSMLPRYVFKHQTRLHTLLLDGNGIQTLPVDVFRPMAALTYLSLSRNKLRNVTDAVLEHNSTVIGTLDTLNVSLNEDLALEGMDWALINFIDISGTRVVLDRDMCQEGHSIVAKNMSSIKPSDPVLVRFIPACLDKVDLLDMSDNLLLNNRTGMQLILDHFHADLPLSELDKNDNPELQLHAPVFQLSRSPVECSLTIKAHLRIFTYTGDNRCEPCRATFISSR